MIELMRDRITIQKSSVKTDKIGNHAVVWEDVYSCAAYANNLSGKEYWAAKQLNAQSELDFIIRYSPRALANVRMVPDAIPGPALGITTFQKIRMSDIPSVRPA